MSKLLKFRNLIPSIITKRNISHNRLIIDNYFEKSKIHESIKIFDNILPINNTHKIVKNNNYNTKLFNYDIKNILNAINGNFLYSYLLMFQKN